METVTENLKETPNSTMSFFKYVFNFDDDNKSEMFNLFQYSFLAIIPLVLVLKVVQQYVPEEDEKNGRRIPRRRGQRSGNYGARVL